MNNNVPALDTPSAHATEASESRDSKNHNVPTTSRFIQAEEMAFFRVPLLATELPALLTHRAIPAAITSELLSASLEERIDAIVKNYAVAYRPVEEEIDFVQILTANMRLSMSERDFSNPIFKQHWYNHEYIKKGGHLNPIPNCVQGMGRSMILLGPSQNGTSSLLKRIKALAGETIRIPGGKYEPPIVHVVPLLILNYPACGTVRGLLTEMREKLRLEIASADSSHRALEQLSVSDINVATNAAIGFCIRAMVGAIVIDGASSKFINKGTGAILSFLARLKQATGIPLVLAGTCAFMHITGLDGSTSSNLLDGDTTFLPPFEKPKLDANKRIVTGGLWYQANDWHWSLGVLPKSVSMPPMLPFWTHVHAQGRRGWLKAGFKKLHLHLARNPDVAINGLVTKELVKDLFDKALLLQKTARDAVFHSSTKMGVTEVDFVSHMDHFLPSFFHLPKYKALMPSLTRRAIQ
ncbi:hypothetical protein I5R65_21640 [Herbaspirillum sp. AP02]|uniref:hypothetical protein n=1 Tax=unclassified Herbaspirillum TaxID=2624150 RepID=UPI0015D9782E|nr:MULTISPECIES: hypothetical protein [unclassified Herbaspirillum]MBG7622084.1 hypothetical protein [Herbaspirillum sp. AP02]NZD69103.1 hypothetical protein [Herbaspirillum sp. AP21]